MKMVELRGSRSYGSVLTRKPRRPSLVEILCRAWTGALIDWGSAELLPDILKPIDRGSTALWPGITRIMISVQSSFLLTQYHFYWHEWLSSSSRKTDIVRKFSSLVRNRTSDPLLTWLTREPLGYTGNKLKQTTKCTHFFLHTKKNYTDKTNLFLLRKHSHLFDFS
jgi:hypothetical protein